MTERQETRDRKPLARIVRGVGGNYWIRTDDGVTGQASARGIFRKTNTKLLPGDIVSYAHVEEGDPPFVINTIEPRRNQMQRPPLANLDGLLVVFAVADPEPDLYLLDKILCAAMSLDLELCLIFTKTDLEPVRGEHLQAVYAEVLHRVYLSDGRDDAVIAHMKRFCEGKVVSVAGPSGAGKSTLVNRLFGADYMETGEISEKNKKGRQTTRHTELFWHGQGYLADSPGFQSLLTHEMAITTDDLLASYHDLGTMEGKCRFHSCKHLVEPGCFVAETVRSGRADPGRYARYQHLRKELDQVTHW